MVRSDFAVANQRLEAVEDFESLVPSTGHGVGVREECDQARLAPDPGNPGLAHVDRPVILAGLDIGRTEKPRREHEVSVVLQGYLVPADRGVVVAQEILHPADAEPDYG